ncbi:MAG: hypothetical protein PSV16_11515 [Flavobacterium sp.]|nr:hypothetical protein [Flavobacterium sp.]
MATEMGRTLEKETHNEPASQLEKESDKNGAAGESEKQENFMLQLKIKEKEEALKASYEVINVYKEQNQKMQLQRNEAQ